MTSTNPQPSPSIGQLNSFAAVRVEGPKPQRVLDFLQGQISCDLARCSAQKAARGAFCNRAGRVVGDAVLLPPESAMDAAQCWRMLVRAELLPALTELLTPYARLARVQLNVDAEAICGAYSAPGPIGGDFLGITQQDRAQLIRLGPDDGADNPDWGLVWLPSDWADFDATSPEMADAGVRLAAMLAGAPFLAASASGSFTPHELNYHNAGLVHFDKGCYLGQEVVARMQHLGKLKKHFAVLAMPAQDAAAQVQTAGGKQLPMADMVCADKALAHFATCLPDKEIAGGELQLASGAAAKVLRSYS